jgi:hypothetical protein
MQDIYTHFDPKHPTSALETSAISINVKAMPLRIQLRVRLAEQTSQQFKIIRLISGRLFLPLSTDYGLLDNFKLTFDSVIGGFDELGQINHTVCSGQILEMVTYQGAPYFIACINQSPDADGESFKSFVGVDRTEVVCNLWTSPLTDPTTWKECVSPVFGILRLTLSYID